MTAFLLLWAAIATILSAYFARKYWREKMKSTELQTAVQGAVAVITDLRQKLSDATANSTPDADVQAAVDALNAAANPPQQ